MGADIEWIVGVLRAGENFKGYGDPYELACTVVKEADTITFIGASSETVVNLLRERDSIAALLPSDVRFVQWERRKEGKVKRVRIDISRSGNVI